MKNEKYKTGAVTAHREERLAHADYTKKTQGARQLSANALQATQTDTSPSSSAELNKKLEKGQVTEATYRAKPRSHQPGMGAKRYST